MKILSFCIVAILVVVPQIALADFVIQATSASTDMGGAFGEVDRVIDQSGLSSGYTSGVTDFDSYIASNPTHDIGVNPPNGWGSDNNVTTGNFDFNLGGNYTIDAFALWNLGGNIGNNIVGFTLLADDNANFTSATNLGSFSANPNTGSAAATLPEVFTFSATTATFVRMQITSNNNNTTNTIFGEAAFRGTAVPEPASLGVLALMTGLVSVTLRRGRND